jgi:hypothetical protein
MMFLVLLFCVSMILVMFSSDAMRAIVGNLFLTFGSLMVYALVAGLFFMGRGK